MKSKKRIRTICVDAKVDKLVAMSAKQDKRSYSAQASFILEQYLTKGGTVNDEKEETQKD
jgi:hypothetical protein